MDRDSDPLSDKAAEYGSQFESGSPNTDPPTYRLLATGVAAGSHQGLSGLEGGLSAGTGVGVGLVCLQLRVIRELDVH